MNITKAADLDKTAKFTLEWNGETVAFEALTNTLTPAFLDSVDKISGYPKAVADTVQSWDVTSDDEGTAWPLTTGELAKLPVDFLTAILNKVSESWTGDKKKQKA